MTKYITNILIPMPQCPDNNITDLRAHTNIKFFNQISHCWWTGYLKLSKIEYNKSESINTKSMTDKTLIILYPQLKVMQVFMTQKYG